MLAESPSMKVDVDRIERRTVTRQSVNREAKLIWRDAPSRFSKTVGRLVDISEKGAGIIADTIPSHAGVLWLGLEDLPWEWVRAKIRATRCRDGQRCYHVEFTEPCPPGLLEIATGLRICELILMWTPE